MTKSDWYQGEDPLAQFESWAHMKSRAEIGGLIKEYIAESNHSNWDGYNRRDLTGIRRFLTDLMKYHSVAAKGGHNFVTSTNNVNPVK